MTFLDNIFKKIAANKREAIIFTLILVVGVFFRAYNFPNWLHYEIDQSYDTLLVTPAVENGVGNLPLLGPTAGGGRALRLGPAYYYLEYLSAKIFGNTPPGHAAFVLIFSILSLPLFYLLVRKYFSKYIALPLLAIFSVSIYLIIYSRFSWSPNVLPFFVILTLYALFQSTSREGKNKERWFLVTISAIAVITQIHFNAFFIVPPVVIIFLAIKRPKFQIKTWLMALAIFIILYSPLIISDIKMHGQNLNYFMEKIGSGTTSHSKFSEKLMQTIQYHASDYFLIETGIDKINGSKISGYGFQTKNTRNWRIATILLLLLELGILCWNLKKEKDQQRKDFLLLTGIWFAISFLYFFSVAKSGLNIYPRFFLLMTPLAIILPGFLLEKINPTLNKKRLAVFLAIICLLLFSNLTKVETYFSQLSQVQTQPIDVQTEDVFPNTARVTLSQQYAIIDFIESVSEKNGFPVYLSAKHEYESIFWYHLEKRGVPFRQSINLKQIYAQSNYFVILFAKESLGKYASLFDVAEKKDFGALIAYRLIPKPETSAIPKQTAPDEIPTEQAQIAEILTWNKLFSK